MDTVYTVFYATIAFPRSLFATQVTAIDSDAAIAAFTARTNMNCVTWCDIARGAVKPSEYWNVQRRRFKSA